MASDDPDTTTIDGSGWLVEMPRRMPNLVFPADEYGRAFENATGVSIDDREEPDDVDYPDEDRIRSIDFGEPTEVPIADV